ncbi:MAG: ATP-binding protein [Vampirovibrionales bacterium]|nr:ATP-binding protein [Vampirovibrionales bacterium]
MTMEAELKGLLPIYEEAVKKDPYLPIIEAITNAFDSIIKANPSNKTVRVSFVTNQSSLLVGQVAQQIDEIVIEDCGTGFDDGNAISFKRVGSTHKEDMGCKGMGRLSWLCCFKRVVIESTYKHGETLRYRELHFSLDKEVEEKEKQTR